MSVDVARGLLYVPTSTPSGDYWGGNSGPMVTRGGLVFLGGGAPYLYAFDKATGAEVWRGATPFPTHGNPMTYRTRSGRQFVAIATGRGTDAALVAFARRKQ